LAEYQGWAGFSPPLSLIDRTVAEATNNWVTVEARVSVTSVPPLSMPYEVTLWLKGGQINLSGNLFIDQFEVFEFIESDEPPGTCDIDLKQESTVVTNETASGAANGQISAVATGSGVIEYSRDGNNWQLGSQFAGLTTGIYLIRVRTQGALSCKDEYPFAVNHGAIAFTFEATATHESISGVKDGAITFSVTGQGVPYSYSTDAGMSWHNGNHFSNLAPGLYYVAVRNAEGNATVKTTTINKGTTEIDRVYHSKNPVTFIKTAETGWEGFTNYRLYNEVRVEDDADSGTYVAKLKLDLPPETNGKATFYVNEAFRGVFSFNAPPPHHSEIIRLTDRIKRFKNYSGKLTGIQTIPTALEASTSNVVLFGGVSKFHFPTINFFGTYLQTKKKFLTWAPVEKYVDRLQEDYLNFYVYGNFTALKLRIRAFFDDGTQQTAIVRTKTGTRFSELYQLPAGPSNSGALLIDPAKNVVKYDLDLVNQGDVTITEKRTFHISAVTPPLSRYFMYLNSLGAFEVIRFTGQATEKVTYNRDVVQKFLPHDYKPLDGEFSSTSTSRQRQVSFSSGFIKNRFAEEWHEYMQEILGTSILFDITTGARIPMAIVNGEFSSEDQNYQRFIRIEARDSYDDVVFTPGTI
jgi:hypothetical protein